MKPGPIVAMVSLLVLGFWLAAGPSVMQGGLRAAPGAVVGTIDAGAAKIRYERVEREDGTTEYRVLSGPPSASRAVMSREAFWAEIERVEAATVGRHWLLRALNISTWWNLAWVGVGFGGQMAFFGRMFVQWVTSERQKRSVVPAAFWWLSLVGGVALFAYFVWRRDVIGVLGQSTGVVIYARNLRLIGKARRREARAASGEGATAPENDPAAQPV